MDDIEYTLIKDIDENLEILGQDVENTKEGGVDDISEDDMALVEYDDELEGVESGAEIELEGVESGAEIANKGDNEDVSGSLLEKTASTLDEIYNMYCRHAQVNGFSVRKGTTRLSTTGVALGKIYFCSCAGVKQKKVETTKSGKRRKEKQVGITRVNCKALLFAKLNKEGIYEVMKHEMVHNHQLTRPEWSHLHRSARKMTDEKGKAIERMISSGMKTVESFNYMAYEVGGQENLGHTLIDHYNYVSRLNIEKIESGDARTFFSMIEEESEQDEDFFYKVKLDGEARLANIFWRDSRMKEDYKVYGDVVVFDTTYRTNKYNLICAPFVGVNNHWKNVMFGCAFISDETTETFEWLFKQFRKAMGDKHPITIFSDQDLAIANGIKKVFPETRHRLCLWHLQQNATSRFGNLKNNDPFKDLFNKCLSGCMNKDDFEITWKTMVTTYGLQKNAWFTRLYDLREQWCTALSKPFFSAGIRSSQRSESTNHAIGFKARKDTTLTKFYEIFKDTVKRWRDEEVQDEFYCSKSKPETVFTHVGLVNHASEVYTSAVFRDFEKEFIKGLGVMFKVVESLDNTLVFEVQSIGGGLSTKVIFDGVVKLIKCDCMRFEEFGLLCYHCLRILNINSVEIIPDAYILKRWTKLAKSHVWDTITSQRNANEKNEFIAWAHGIGRKYYNLALLCKGNEIARTNLDESYKRELVFTETLMSKEQEETSARSASSRTILDPARSVTKGRSKRKPNHFEKKKKNKASSSNSAPTLEFGSKTPKHLI